MARDQDLDDQIDSDEELLNFDLDDLSLLEDSESEEDPGTEEEMIELVDLVEKGPSEDITRDLKIREWSAAGGKKQGQNKTEARPDDAEKMAAEEEPELDLSDISLEMDSGAEAVKADRMFSGDEITEEDLEGLLQEEEGITLDLKEEGLEIQEKPEDEITEADLQALLSESGEQGLEVEAGEEGPLEIMSDEDVEGIDMEPMEETQVLNLKPAVEETLLVEEPEDILAKEVEELGAAAALEEEEGALAESEVFEQEEEAEMEAVLGLAEEEAQEGEEGEEEAFVEQALAGLDEERLEEIIRNVVGEVVERVARETMTEVAERMIGEAIEALKQNLESFEP